MYYEDTNFTVQTGNLTRDVEKRTSPGGTVVANLRIAVNGRRKEGDQWVDKPNYFSVVAFGKMAENAYKYLKKGRRIIVEGRLDWSEWERDGEKRQGVQIIASRIQYLPTRASIEEQAAAAADAQASVDDAGPVPDGEPVPAGAGGSEEEIPF